MAFSSKLGKHFYNPAIMRQHEQDAAKGNAGAGSRGVKEGGPKSKEPGEESQGVHKGEYFHPDHPENPSPGKHHVVLHHADGQEEHSDHASAEEAHEHLRSHLGQGEFPGEHDGEDRTGTGEDCPECGAAMIDGKCPECGYEERAGGHSGSGGDQDEDENGGY